MKSLIKILIFLVLIPKLDAHLINIYHGPKERQQANWVKTILIKKGIPADYVVLKISYQNCQFNQLDRNPLLELCLNNQKDLKTIQFARKKFFWQLSPLIENN